MERYLSKEGIAFYRCKLIEDERSAATVKKYMRDLACFAAFVGQEPVTKETAIRYKQHLAENYKPASVNSMLAAVNGFFKTMGWLDCLVKPLKIQRQTFRDRARELTREEYFHLLEEARARGRNRLYLLMQTICATGIRVSELPFITVEAVRQGSATVSLKGKTRKVLIPSALRRALRRYARGNGIRKGSIFVTRGGGPVDRSNILHDMKELCKGAGVDPRKVFPHNLRHLFACQYYKVVKDLSRLADILGHSNVNTTRIYTSVSGEEQARQLERLGLVLQEKKSTS